MGKRGETAISETGASEVSAKYEKVLSDGTKCEFVFAIKAEKVNGNAEEILHEMAQLSKRAYIHIGNKMVYGTADQEELKKLTAEKRPVLG